MKTFIIIIIFFISCILYSNELENKTYYGEFCQITFKNKTMIYSGTDLDTGKDYNYEYTYEIKTESKLTFIFINNQKILVLYSDDFLFLYCENNDKCFLKYFNSFFGISKGGPGIRINGYYSTYEIKSSSSLKEGDIYYSPENLISCDPDKCWVEGAEGYGIGETITLKYFRANFLVFSNGYVSVKKPYLYEDNSRVRKIMITDLKNKKSITVNIMDTPNLQRIKLPDNFGNEIEIKILDIYPGRKYKDTCINFIILDENTD